MRSIIGRVSIYQVDGVSDGSTNILGFRFSKDKYRRALIKIHAIPEVVTTSMIYEYDGRVHPDNLVHVCM
jgi:hypothetical protein